MNDQPESKKDKKPPPILPDLSDLPFSGVNETAIIRGGLHRIRHMLDEAHPEDDDTLVTDPHSITLVVRGMEEPLHFGPTRTKVILGRIDQRTAERPDIDLTHLGAAERGVSRKHARLEMIEKRLYVVDLDSANGTFLSRTRLNPFVPNLIHRGDEVLLARLAVKIIFE